MNEQMNNQGEPPQERPAPETKPEVKQVPPKSAPPKKELTPAELQKRRKRIVMPLMFLIFAVVMWVIFSPSKKDDKKAAGVDGFNSEVPMPEDDGIYSDKRTAYEQEAVKEKEQEKQRSLQDLSAMFSVENETDQERTERERRQIAMAPKPPEYYENPERFGGKPQGGVSGSHGGSLHSSATAWQDINRQLGGWDEEPARNEESLPSAVEERMQELERRLAEAEALKAAEDEQTALLEKSYRLAARYMPSAAQGAGSDGGSATDGSSAPQGTAATVPATNTTLGTNGKTQVRPVAQVRRSVVSQLSAPMSDAEFVDAFSRPRNLGFVTAAGNEGLRERNTIRASVYQTVKLTSGKELQMRLREPMRAGDHLIPAGTIVTGVCSIEGERMDVVVSSIQHGGNIIPVELIVYDPDGQRGIAVPGNEEVNAMKEVASTLAQSAGTSITISDDAGSQLAADLGRGVIQGASQYVSKKMSVVRVTVKANYGLLLLPKNQ